MKRAERTDSPIEWSDWRGEIPATLMFIIQQGKVLLIEKLTGIGQGKINGPGGKIDSGETALQAVVRECQEELHITPHAPKKMGELYFAMSNIPDIHCHVFMADSFDGVPTSTREANPLWTDLLEIPYDKMWADDQHWLPQMLAGERFIGRFVFEGEKIVWMETHFGEGVESLWLGDPVMLKTV